jgi:DNA-directed RNA polymerase sigma subunit (sigma70/sigma32)
MKYEIKDYAEHLIGRLDSKDVELLKMRYWHDMAFSEIGKEFNISGTAIRNQILNILKKCRGFIYREVDKPIQSITEVEKVTALWETKVNGILLVAGHSGFTKI